jgi:hypothetical protein
VVEMLVLRVVVLDAGGAREREKIGWVLVACACSVVVLLPCGGEMLVVCACDVVAVWDWMWRAGRLCALGGVCGAEAREAGV